MKALDYKQSKANGDIHKLSRYALKEAPEFFAEAFTMCHMERENLPPKIEEMMEKVLKQ